jgi:predicted TIM-barrel fold metal-dependent hydrolase
VLQNPASASGLYGPCQAASAIVGHANLNLGDRVTPVLEALQATSPNRCRGIRHTVTWDPYPEVLATWRRDSAAVAACPNVHLKLGVIGMPRLGLDWHTRTKPIGSEELATAMTPFMTYSIAQFGPDRCMFEPNFPPEKVSSSHHILFNAFKRFSQGYSAAERAALFHDTAVRAYRISDV